MAHSDSYNIFAFEIAFYALTFFPTLAALVLQARHSIRTLPTWFFLFTAVVLQLAGAAIMFTIWNGTATNEHTVFDGPVLIQISIIPLLLAVYGVIQQAMRPIRSARLSVAFGDLAFIGFSTILFIALVMHSWALVTPVTWSPTQAINLGLLDRVYEAAITFEFLAWFFLLLISGLAIMHWHSAPSSSHKLLIATSISIFFLGLQVIETIIFAYAPYSSSRYRIDYSLPARVILGVLPPVVTVLSLTVAGLMNTRSNQSEDVASKGDIALGEVDRKEQPRASAEA